MPIVLRDEEAASMRENHSPYRHLDCFVGDDQEVVECCFVINARAILKFRLGEALRASEHSANQSAWRPFLRTLRSTHHVFN
jgi:hypothetical protein